MASPSRGLENSLRITRLFQAPREKVFEAWTRPEQMSRWCAPSEEYSTSAEVDLRVGGAYRIEMTHASGSVHTAVGEYREMTPPERLVYTWSWEDGGVKDTLVTIELRELDGGTELTLVHERFPDAEQSGKHEQGWTGCLKRFESALAD